MNRNMFVGMMIVASCLCMMAAGCVPSAGILQQYEAYGEAGVDANKAGVSISMATEPLMTGDTLWALVINYSNPSLRTDKKFIEKLAEQWFIVDAENPDVKFPVKIGEFSILRGDYTPIAHGHNILMRDLGGMTGYTYYNERQGHYVSFSLSEANKFNARFLLIGFKGIRATESEKAATQPLFFLVENNGGRCKVLTPIPRLSGELFPNVSTR